MSGILQTLSMVNSTVAASPTFNAELNDRWTATASGSTSVRTLVGSCAAGHTLAVAVGWISATQTISSVTDSRSNTYTVHTISSSWDGGNGKLQWASGYMTTALQVGDTVTITWASPALTYRAFAYFDVSNAASAGQPDQQSSAIGNSTSPSASASTTATNTCLLGIVGLASNSRTYGSSNWTVSGAVHDWPDLQDRTYYMYKNASASGAQDPGGTVNASINWGVSWIALK